jgi:hypothetical protein
VTKYDRLLASHRTAVGFCQHVALCAYARRDAALIRLASQSANLRHGDLLAQSRQTI